jgi:hypothetical protein
MRGWWKTLLFGGQLLQLLCDSSRRVYGDARARFAGLFVLDDFYIAPGGERAPKEESHWID